MSLSMAISISSYIFSPFTIPLLFFVLTQKQIHVDIKNLFLTLMIVNFLPLIASQIVRRFGNSLISKTKDYYTSVNIFLVSFMVYIVVAVQAKTILANPLNALMQIFWMYVLFIGLYIVGYYTGYWRTKKDKISLAVSKTYMNNALAIGLAAAFFSPQVALFMVLSEVPWTTSQGIFKYITKYLD